MLNIKKTTANRDLSCADNQQMFAEITPQQAETVEGGAFLLINSIQAIKAGADLVGKDEAYITVNGGRIFGPKGMDSGDSANVNRGLGFDGSARIELFDEDGFFNGSDDNMGGFTVSGATNGQVRRRVSGSGSTYDVFYQVFG